MLGLPAVDALSWLRSSSPRFRRSSVAQVPVIGSAEIERVPAYLELDLDALPRRDRCGRRRSVGGWSGGAGRSVSLGWSALIGWTLLGTAAALLLMVVFLVRERPPGTRRFTAAPKSSYPERSEERRLFVWLSFAAGVGEELAYRGYAIPMLLAPCARALGASGMADERRLRRHARVPRAARRSCGRRLHRARARRGASSASGSLWPAILAHTLLDIVAGTLAGRHPIVFS